MVRSRTVSTGARAAARKWKFGSEVSAAAADAAQAKIAPTVATAVRKRSRVVYPVLKDIAALCRRAFCSSSRSIDYQPHQADTEQSQGVRFGDHGYSGKRQRPDRFGV